MAVVEERSGGGGGESGDGPEKWEERGRRIHENYEIIDLFALSLDSNKWTFQRHTPKCLRAHYF